MEKKPDLIDRSQLVPDLGDASVEYGAKLIHYSQDVIQAAEEISLYQAAASIDPARALDLIRGAQSEEERNFYAYVADMNLQRRQRAQIGDELND